MSDEDKKQRYKEGLSDRVKRGLAVSGKEQDTFSEVKMAALEIDRSLIEIDEDSFKPFRRGKGRASTLARAHISAASTFSGNCFLCGKPGHRKFECPQGKGKAKVAATSTGSSSTALSLSSSSIAKEESSAASLLSELKALRKEVSELRSLKEGEDF